jgi:RimJ/RimL family protein N-acetyltransferase
VKRYLNGPTRVPREEWIRGMESKLSRCQALAVLAKDTGQFAGRAALNAFRDSEDVREIQVVISKEFWGRHFGCEVCKVLIATAFDELGAEQVVGVVHPENAKSLKLLRRLGFEKTGVVKQYSMNLHSQVNDLKFTLPRAAYERWAEAVCQPTKTDL